MEQIIYIAYALNTISLIVFGIFICRFISKRENDFKLREKQIYFRNLSAQKIEDIQKMLEMLINESFEDYLANNPEFISSNYITEESEIKIIKDIADRVVVRMSKAMYEKITLYYNESIITDLIAEKVYLKVTNYIISVNSSKL